MQSSQSILINSEKRESGTSNDFSYHIIADNNYTHCCVLGCNIPVSYYLIQTGFNTCTLIEEGQNITITFPPGNYNAQSFLTVTKGLLNAASTHSYVYNITFDNDYTGRATGLFTYTVVGALTPPSIQFPALGELHAQWGFTHASTNVFNVTGTLISTSVVSFIPETVLQVWSDICADNNLITIFHDNAIPYSNISFQCQTQLYSRQIKGHGKDSIYNFKLLNKNGAVIDLNGQSMLLNLLLFTPEDNSYKDGIKNYIKYKVSSE